MRKFSEYDRHQDVELGAAALGGFLLGILAVFAVRYALHALERERALGRPRKMDELIVNRRYEPRPAANGDDPWTHYEEVLG
ncbi:MAG: hypothetical protein ACREHE_01080 [Rhizomicrobium sp.]